MKIEYLAIWVKDLEFAKEFYQKYFEMKSGEKYINTTKGFQSYFMSFLNGGSTRLELMNINSMKDNVSVRGMLEGYAHIAISVGNRKKVDELTNQLRSDGYEVIGEPRITGDGFYESIIQDREGNWIEITE